VNVPSVAQPISREVRMRTVPTGTRSTITEFIFPYAPIAMTYDGLAPEYVQIERPQNLPLVDLKKFNLLTVSLQFLVAVPNDGISVSVDNELRVLRGLANSIYPVSFINMDGMVTNPFNITRLGPARNASAFFFRITDLSINALRRNTNNEVTSAEVSMSLVEVANPSVNVITFPAITYPPIVTQSAASKKTVLDDDDVRVGTLVDLETELLTTRPVARR
jgi:hypothetical protein